MKRLKKADSNNLKTFAVAYSLNGKIEHTTVKCESPDDIRDALREKGIRFTNIEGWDDLSY